MAAIHDARMLHLFRELEPFGIRGDRIKIAYHAYMQDYDVLISGGALTDRQIEGICSATRMGGG